MGYQKRLHSVILGALMAAWMFSFLESAYALRPIVNADQEGIVRVTRQGSENAIVQFGILNEALTGDKGPEADPQFVTLSESKQDNAQSVILTAGIERIFKKHPILGAKLKKAHQKLDMKEIFYDPFSGTDTLPKKDDTVVTTTLQLYTDDLMAIDSSVFNLLPPLDRAKALLYLLLRQQNFSTSVEKLEAFVNFVFSNDYEKESISDFVTMVHRTFNFDAGLLSADLQDSLDSSMMTISHQDSPDAICFEVAALKPVKFQRDGSDGLEIQVKDSRNAKLRLDNEDHSIDYAYGPMFQFIKSLSGQQIGRLYSFDEHHNSTHYTFAGHQICGQYKDNSFQVQSLRLKLQAKITDIANALQAAIPEFNSGALETTLGELNSQYENLSLRYATTYQRQDREKLNEELNNLNVRILGTENGFFEVGLQPDPDFSKKMAQGQAIDINVRFHFVAESGPVMNLMPL